MVVAGRVLPDGDVAIMMVEAESTEQTWELVRAGKTAPTEPIVAAGLEAAKPFIKALCDAQAELAAQVPEDHGRVPDLPGLPGRRLRRGGRRGHATSCPR